MPDEKNIDGVVAEPCPFCGTVPDIEFEFPYRWSNNDDECWVMGCSNPDCGVEMNVSGSPCDAVRKWNKRA